jgi:hypothetical protein
MLVAEGDEVDLKAREVKGGGCEELMCATVGIRTGIWWNFGGCKSSGLEC